MLRDGGELEELANQPRRAALLVLLAVERECARERVLDLLWGEREPERARRALNQTVYELRRQLGEHAITVQGERIAAGGEVQSDIAIFQQAAQNRDRASALEVYRGPFLDGIYLSATHEFEEWCARHRSRLARQHRKLRIEHIEALRAEDRLPAALAAAARAAEDDPADDDYQHRYIELLIAAGQRAQAVRTYEAFNARLAAQGLAPLEHTRQLLEQLHAGSADAAPQAGDEEPYGAGNAPLRSASPRHESRAAVSEPERASVSEAPVEAPAARTRPRSRIARVLAGASVAVLLTLAGFSLMGPGEAPVEAAPQRVAVLPFEDLSPGAGYPHIAHGLGDALMRELQQRLPAVAVLSRDAAAKLRGVAPDSIARAVGPALLFTGSFARVADSVRLQVELIDGATLNVLRALEVRAPWTDELRVVDGLVARVLEDVQPVLGEQMRARELRTGTTSSSAFAFYLRADAAGEAANRLAGARDYDGAAHLLQLGDSLLAQAEIADPAWASPAVLRAELSQYRALLVLLNGRAADTSIMHDHVRTALAHAERALQRDPGDAAALAMRGMLRARWTALAPHQAAEGRDNWLEGAASDLRAAVAIDAGMPEVWTRLAEVYDKQGRFPQALDAARNAHRLDVYGTHAGELLERLSAYAFEAGDAVAARAWCEEGAERFPGDVRYELCRSLLLATAENPALDTLAQLATAAQLLDRNNGFPVVIELNYALGLARAGQPERAEAQIATSRQRGYTTEALFREAVVRIEMRQYDEAVTLLQEFEARNPGAEAVRWSRLIAPLRTHPAYASIRELNPSR